MIGYLPENAPLYPDLSVQSQLKMIAELRCVPIKTQSQLISDSVAKTGISAQLTRPIRELSKGYRQRVGIAQSILHLPRVLILDEPTAALSPLYQQQIIDRIDALRAKGITVLIVEQNARLSLSRSDRGYIFSNGKVVHTDAASRILVDPQINEYFLGTKKE